MFLCICCDCLECPQLWIHWGESILLSTSPSVISNQRKILEIVIEMVWYSMKIILNISLVTKKSDSHLTGKFWLICGIHLPITIYSYLCVCMPAGAIIVVDTGIRSSSSILSLFCFLLIRAWIHFFCYWLYYSNANLTLKYWKGRLSWRVKKKNQKLNFCLKRLNK